ncbi:MAG1430 family protein [Mycoplasmopsis gallinarum]|uniref:Uncharacterized protein n=1 Tax=Mycoplasmopsis gallinarum TaxID=29557 RepID=A0A168RGI8_9BACT|nr:hypothetical protein [Mycoplasmopsis gallinarum]OAB48963.1 hypothetical protein MGALLINA_02950 [Mycoplasmopsis gallinarum]
MKKYKLNVMLGSIVAIAGLSAIATVSTIAYLKRNQNASGEEQLKLYEFVATKNLNKDVLPSTYSYASYDIPYSSEQRDPDLKYNSNTDKGFWAYQLELNPNTSAYKTNNFDPLFNLKTKNNAPIDLLKDKYNIYYHSYANNINGTLFLKVSLEDKNTPSDTVSERMKTWKSFVYKIDGFKTLSQIPNEELDNPAVPSWNFSSTTTLNIDFSNDRLTSINDLLNNLNQNQIAQPDSTATAETWAAYKNQVKEAWDKTNKYLSFATKESGNQSYYMLDKNRPVWFSAVENSTMIKIHYYVKKFVPIASIDNLNAISEIELNQIYSQNININYAQLKEITSKIKVIPFNNADLTNDIPYGDNFIFVNSTTSSNPRHNTYGGYYEKLDLIFDNTLTNINNYELKFYKYNPETGGTKADDKYPNTPLVSYDAQTGQAKFAYILKLKNSSPINGIGEFIGVVTADAQFKIENNA